MSYFKSMGGVQSQPMGARVFRRALSGISEYSLPAIGSTKPPPPPPVKRRIAMGASSGPAWYRQMQGTSLGEDETTSLTTEPVLSSPTVDDATFRSEALSTLVAMKAQEAKRIELEERRGYLQLAATLSIPLAAFIWRKLLKRTTPGG